MRIELTKEQQEALDEAADKFLGLKRTINDLADRVGKSERSMWKVVEDIVGQGKLGSGKYGLTHSPEGTHIEVKQDEPE